MTNTTPAATLGQLIDTHGVDVLEHLDRQLEVPVLGGLQFQGDLAVIPADHGVRKTGPAVPVQGIAVIAAANGGHEHRLLAAAMEAWFDAAAPGGQDLGRLVVTGGAAYLAHPEHGYLGIAPGSYILRRQREQADEERLIAD